MSLYFNATEICKNVDIRDVLRNYHLMEGDKKAHCPKIEHPDKNASCAIKNNRCTCFVCDESFSPIDVVMEQENMTFIEACEYMVDAYLLPDTCYFEKSARKEKDDFPLTDKECEFLNLKSTSSVIEIPVGVEETRKEKANVSYEESYFYKGKEISKEKLQKLGRVNPYDYDKVCLGYGIKTETQFVSLRKFWKEDKIAFCEFVSERIESKLTEFKEFLSKYGDGGNKDETIRDLQKHYEDLYDKFQSILKENYFEEQTFEEDEKAMD